ncbi:hypothetical protein KKC63_03385 [Patescibacteria group bacterium]|nr:hypothetical protein [Patescibacteria group bacterium]MBU4023281.1 hypothetical protein [Patescibacteria group bacterium]
MNKENKIKSLFLRNLKMRIKAWIILLSISLILIILFVIIVALVIKGDREVVTIEPGEITEEDKGIRNIDDCEEIEDELERNECFATVAAYDGNLSSCDQIENISGRDNCYLELVKLYYVGQFDLSGGEEIYAYPPVPPELVCRNIKTADIKDDCYLVMAQEQESSVYCWPIEDQTKEDSCYADLEIDWRTITEEELGIKFTLSNDFIKVFGIPYYSHIHWGTSGKFIDFDFKLPEKYTDTYLFFRGYTADYEHNLTFPRRGWIGDGDILETCSSTGELDYERECKIIEINGEKAILQTVLFDYEGAHDVYVEVYLSNPSDSEYKGLNFSIVLWDAQTKILENSDNLISEFYTQSQNIMKNQNLSEEDEERLTLFNDMLDSIRFIR